MVHTGNVSDYHNKKVSKGMGRPKLTWHVVAAKDLAAISLAVNCFMKRIVGEKN